MWPGTTMWKWRGGVQYVNSDGQPCACRTAWWNGSHRTGLRPLVSSDAPPHHYHHHRQYFHNRPPRCRQHRPGLGKRQNLGLNTQSSWAMQMENNLWGEGWSCSKPMINISLKVFEAVALLSFKQDLYTFEESTWGPFQKQRDANDLFSNQKNHPLCKSRWGKIRQLMGSPVWHIIAENYFGRQLRCNW